VISAIRYNEESTVRNAVPERTGRWRQHHFFTLRGPSGPLKTRSPRSGPSPPLQCACHEAQNQRWHQRTRSGTASSGGVISVREFLPLSFCHSAGACLESANCSLRGFSLRTGPLLLLALLVLRLQHDTAIIRTSALTVSFFGRESMILVDLQARWLQNENRNSMVRSPDALCFLQRVLVAELLHVPGHLPSPEVHRLCGMPMYMVAVGLCSASPRHPVCSQTVTNRC
jgi:hypothetical protein